MHTQNINIKPRQEKLGIIYGRLNHAHTAIDKFESSEFTIDGPTLHQIATARPGRQSAPSFKSSEIILHQRDLKRIEKAIAYVDRNFADHISPEGLSVEVKMSISKLQAGLKYKTGFTLSGYQEQIRIRISKDLLENSNKTLKLISKTVGFKTHSHFTEVFKNITHLTPSEYRNRYGC